MIPLLKPFPVKYWYAFLYVWYFLLLQTREYIHLDSFASEELYNIPRAT